MSDLSDASESDIIRRIMDQEPATPFSQEVRRLSEEFTNRVARVAKGGTDIRGAARKCFPDNLAAELPVRTTLIPMRAWDLPLILVATLLFIRYRRYRRRQKELRHRRTGRR